MFTRTVPDVFKKDQNYIDLIAKLDTALNEIADVLAFYPKLGGKADWLRSIINHEIDDNEQIEKIKKRLEKEVPMVNVFNKALETLKK